MNDSYSYKVIKEEEIKSDEDVVITLNDFYANSDFCDATTEMMAPPATGPSYSIVKDVKEDPKNIYHDVSYAI